MGHWPSSEGHGLWGAGLAVRASAYGALAYRILVHRILTSDFKSSLITERTTIKNNFLEYFFLEFHGPRTELILVS